MLLIALATPAAPAHAADGRWQRLEGIWSWFTEVWHQGFSIDLNGGSTATSEQSLHIDPNGGSTATSEQSIYIDPNG